MPGRGWRVKAGQGLVQLSKQNGTRRDDVLSSHQLKKRELVPHGKRHRWLSGVLLTVTFSLGLSCGPADGGADDSSWAAIPEGSLLASPMDDFPKHFSDVGLYPDMSLRRQVSDGVIPYAPQYPLWSNGSSKQRHIFLAEGEVDTSSPRHWRFPEGTLLFKTFAFVTPTSDGEEVPVETRILRRNAEVEGEWGVRGLPVGGRCSRAIVLAQGRSG